MSNNRPNLNTPYLSDQARKQLFDSPPPNVVNNSNSFNNGNSNNFNNSFRPSSRDFSPYSNQEILDKQKSQMKDQDDYLDSLSHSVLRSKDIAIQIGTTAESQTKELESLNVHVDKTSLNLRMATKNVLKIGEQSKTTGYWVVICILFLVLIIISAAAMAT